MYKKVFYKMPVRKIRYFESDKRKIYIYGTEVTNIFYKKLDEAEKQLAQKDVKFLRISKSYLVNVSHIREFRYEKNVMDDGREFNTGSWYKGKIRQSYMELMQEG
ncbi:MAG: LytTR family transcriptional regulator [Lachnospiraceae bacterium]|nr:LytTR family transcriptional regulator [Lachnospiraceae bacterium]